MPQNRDGVKIKLRADGDGIVVPAQTATPRSTCMLRPVGTPEVGIGQEANLAQPSFVQLDNIQTISKQRLGKYAGTLDDASMKLVSEKVVLALNLEDAFTSVR